MTPGESSLDCRHLAELRIIAQRGAEDASASLGRFVGREVHLKVTDLEVRPLQEVPTAIGAMAGAVAVGLATRVTGEVGGNALLLLGRPEAGRLCALLGKDPGAAGPLDALARSMLEETANITLTAFMNSLTAHLGARCLPSSPTLRQDWAEAILSTALTESAAAGDQVILFATEFVCGREGLNAVMLFLPDPACMSRIREGLGEA